jgi:type II restriction/modification system DNA methylase subunit YeeA
MDEDGGSLNPETITVLDPACGSGHILVEAYAVLKGIYLERGYPARSIPRLILEKNLYGLDIDDRAAQLAGFALLMKARADDRRLLDGPIKLNVLSLQESTGMDLDEFADHMKPHGIDRTVLGSLLGTFAHAKTFGSLIQIPKVLEDGLAGLEDGIAQAIENGDVFARAAAQDLVPLVQQAKILAMKFDAVVANPPYMGTKGMNAPLKFFAELHHPTAKTDLYAMFIERGGALLKATGFNSMVTMQGWMFSSSFDEFRESILATKTIVTEAQFGPRAFGEISGEVVQTAAFSISANHYGAYRPTFFRLVDGTEEDKRKGLLLRQGQFDRFSQRDLTRIPGSPVAYWTSRLLLSTFNGKSIGSIARFCSGMSTGDNPRFQRLWHEVSLSKISFDCKGNDKTALKRWYPCNSGGNFRKWYGNNEIVVDWQNNGARIKSHKGSAIRNSETYFKKGLTYSKISSGRFAARYKEEGFVYDDTGRAVVCEDQSDIFPLLGVLCSNIAHEYLKVLAPLMSFTSTELARIPLVSFDKDAIAATVKKLVAIAKADWDEHETSWEFGGHPLLFSAEETRALEQRWTKYDYRTTSRLQEMKSLEEENNLLLSETYRLSDEIDPAVPEDQITLSRADRKTDSQRLISYAIGCMMGRYSLDEPGLIYAHAGNVGFDATRYKTFPADADGILPVTDELWFEDDAAKRFREFLLAVWSASTFDENMAWLAESLGIKGNETPDETIRRYLASSFFKDHLQTYKKRPIYWLFSSGRQGAFQALVYLHRYHEGTLARLRAEYVVPLTGKMQSRIEMLEKDRDAATSTAARNRIARQIEALKKKHVELLAYDEKLRHYADMRISIDLDDGVKVNYGKFGDLLDSVKIVTGGASDD